MTEPRTALDDIFASFDRSDAPGLVVGVAHQGRTVYRRGFGLASIEHGVANTPWTRMRIGSTSKHFCCLAALLLAEEGRLDLDAAVRHYLPELPALAAPARQPTLRECMSHTSGLRDYLDLSMLASGMAITPRDSALASQLRQAEVNFAAGEQMVYNNGGYQLLSLVIERVSGMPFEAFLQQRLFEPLGMVDTQSVPSDFEIHRGMATQHVPQPDGSYRRGMFPSEEVRGEGAIVSCVDDMLRWLAHLRGPHRVGSEESWAQMLTPARLNNGRVGSYALGLLVERYRGLDVIHHGGTVIGGNCQMLTVPGHGLDIILMSNGVAVSLADLGYRVVEAVLGEDAFPLPADKMAASTDYAPLLGASYLCPSTGLVLGFGDAAGKLGFVVNNSAPIPVREEPGALCLDFSRIVTGPYRVPMHPMAAEAAAPPRLDLDLGGTPLALERLPAVPPALAQAGQALVGRYHAADLNAGASIDFEADGEGKDKALVLRIAGEFGPNRLRLKALSDEVFAWNHVGALAALGGILQVERRDGRVAGLRIHTLRTRHLHFTRIENRPQP